MDLSLLTDAVQRRWAELKGKTAIQLEELLQAEALATSILRAVGEKEQAPAVAAEATAKRARAFTLFVTAYDEVRRAVTYLRWEDGDADAIAPSLYQARATSRRKPSTPRSQSARAYLSRRTTHPRRADPRRFVSQQCPSPQRLRPKIES
ncbi:MAG TPA: hypothetical protein VFX59_12400 [Polyangiales bacterium]|nr:hypothetical protein [Polyangiales bacterium]